MNKRKCWSKTVAIVSYEFGEKSHMANACPKAQKKPLRDKRNKETQKSFLRIGTKAT